MMMGGDGQPQGPISGQEASRRGPRAPNNSDEAIQLGPRGQPPPPPRPNGVGPGLGQTEADRLKGGTWDFNGYIFFPELATLPRIRETCD